MEIEGKRPFAPQRDWDAINRLLEESKNAIASRTTASDRFQVYAAIIETVIIARRSMEGQTSTDSLHFAEKLELRKTMIDAFAAMEKCHGE